MTDTPRKAGGQQDTHADIALLIKIRDRAVCLANSLGYGHYARDSGGFFLDLLSVHQAVGLQLADLLAADDGQFGHDVFGIYRHFDRETRCLNAGFCPRFATPAAGAAANAGPAAAGGAHHSPLPGERA